VRSTRCTPGFAEDPLDDLDQVVDPPTACIVDAAVITIKMMKIDVVGGSPGGSLNPNTRIAMPTRPHTRDRSRPCGRPTGWRQSPAGLPGGSAFTKLMVLLDRHEPDEVGRLMQEDLADELAATAR
jgi:hypothetical protein